MPILHEARPYAEEYFLTIIILWMINLSSIMSTYIKVKPSNKCKRRALMVEGGVQSAQAVTHTRIVVTQDDGTVVIKQVLESLDDTPQKVTAEPKQPIVYYWSK